MHRKCTKTRIHTLGTAKISVSDLPGGFSTEFRLAEWRLLILPVATLRKFDPPLTYLVNIVIVTHTKLGYFKSPNCSYVQLKLYKLTQLKWFEEQVN